MLERISHSFCPAGSKMKGSMAAREREIPKPPSSDCYTSHRLKSTTTATAFGDAIGGREAHVKGDVPYNGAARVPVVSRNKEIGQYPPNRWGLHDMHGSVWEWCRDWHQSRLTGGADPEGITQTSKRSLRGGGWYDSSSYARSACRNKNAPDFRSFALGFRVAIVFIGPVGKASANSVSAVAIKKPLTPVDLEKQANRKLVLAKALIGKNPQAVRRRLQELIRDYPKTKVSEEARELLKKLE